MQIISTVVIPALVIFTMTMVGLELSVRDIRRIAMVVPLLARSWREEGSYASA